MSAVTGVVAAPGRTPVRLFSPGEDRIGITSRQITLCLVAPVFLGPAIGFDQGDLSVYWDWLNDHGGVFGRKVRLYVEDDGLQPSQAVQAMERCATRDPFAIISGSLYDEVDAERTWAEEHRMLFFHTPAREDPTKRFSFSFFPSIETIGRLAAQWVLRAHAGERVAIVHRDSESWTPGYTSFLGVLRHAGVRPVADVVTETDQSVYTEQIIALEQSGAQVVFLWEDPSLPTFEIIEQAKQQGYNPVWVLSPPNLNVITDKLGKDALHPPLEAITYALPYSPGVYGGPYAPYGDEIKGFERAYVAYRGKRPTSDIPWVFWAGWQAFARGLTLCGSDCTRNKLLALNGWSIAPFCPVDFLPGDHFGGHAMTVAKAYSLHGGAAWRPVAGALCRDHF